jgi:hypothetical protein
VRLMPRPTSHLRRKLTFIRSLEGSR